MKIVNEFCVFLRGLNGLMLAYEVIGCGINSRCVAVIVIVADIVPVSKKELLDIQATGADSL